MRHKYETRGIVLTRSPVGEFSAFVVLLTPELGLVRALAQSVRKPGAKLASALATFAESDVVIVRGRDGWRVTGAVLHENWFKKISDSVLRRRAVRVSGLLLRLVAGEAHNPELFTTMKEFFESLTTHPESEHEGLEVLANIRMLSALGLDAGEIPAMPTILQNRTSYISRINRGIEASGL